MQPTNYFYRMFPEFQEYLAPLMGKTMRHVESYVQKRLIESGMEVSRRHIMVLKIIRHRGPQPQKDLAFITDRDKTSLTRLIDTMVKLGLVARIPSKTDKRVNLIGLTAAGEVKLKQTEPILIEIFKELQADISEADRMVVSQVLQNIHNKLCRDKEQCQDEKEA